MLFLTTPSAVVGVLIVALSVAASVAGMKVVRRRVSYESLRENQEAAGYVFSVVGGLYAVLLAFIIVVVWQQYTDAGANAEHEALRVNALIRDSRVFGADAHARLRARLLDYARAVAGDEWRAMAGGATSPAGDETYEQVWAAFYGVEPQTEREKVFYREAVARLNELSGLRRGRVISSRAGLPRALWVLLISGGVVVVAFTYLFGTRSGLAQTLIVASLSGLVGFLLFLVLALDYPFSGSMGIEPDAMRAVIQSWETAAAD